MKAFSLEEYHKNPSRKLITKDGRTVRRILCTDARGNYPVIALVDCGDYDSAFSYTKDGKHIEYKSSLSDLFFASEKHEGYACVHFNEGIYYLDDTIFSSKEEADVESKKWADFVATVKVEWEE